MGSGSSRARRVGPEQPGPAPAGEVAPVAPAAVAPAAATPLEPFPPRSVSSAQQKHVVSGWTRGVLALVRTRKKMKQWQYRPANLYSTDAECTPPQRSSHPPRPATVRTAATHTAPAHSGLAPRPPRSAHAAHLCITYMSIWPQTTRPLTPTST